MPVRRYGGRCTLPLEGGALPVHTSHSPSRDPVLPSDCRPVSPFSSTLSYVLLAYWEKRKGEGVVFSRPLRALRAA